VKRIKVPVPGTVGRSVVINQPSDAGATLGVNLKGPDGSVLTVDALKALLGGTSKSVAASAPAITLWQLIQQVPDNIKDVALLNTAGVVERQSDGSWVTRALGVGAPGMDGEPGEEGPWIPGPPGRDGAQGIPGPIGPSGGPVGPMGPPGFDGEPGEIELHPGPPGQRGTQGAAGPVGPRGFAGPPGMDGEPGEDGMWGPPGAAGPAGSGGSGAVAVPGTIADLIFWWESDNILATNGNNVFALGDRTPWLGGQVAVAGATYGTYVANALNSLGAVNFSGSVYAWSAGSGVTKNVTIFLVFNPTNVSGPGAIVGGSGSGAIELRVYASHLGILSEMVGGGGSSTAPLTAGTWYQANVTYQDSTGAWAFRQARTAAGSGTGTVNVISNITNQIGGATGPGEIYSGKLAAVIIYNRVLTSTEITDVENYLNAKWGV
jgi:hypothetical protein